MRIGFIGAGRMGRPMVGRLVEAGHDVRVLGRSDEKRSAIAELGAVAVTDIREVGPTAEIVVLCVFNDEQVREICLNTDLLTTMAPCSALVVHTTGSPGTVETIAASGEIEVVDAPVSGGPHQAATGELTLFVGGTDEAVKQVRPVLSCYGDPVLHVGPLGVGQKVKLVNNALFAAQIGLLSGAVDVAMRLGVSESTLLAALHHGSAASTVLDLVARGGSVASFVELAGEFVGKDLAVVRDVVAEVDTGLGVLEDVIDAAGL
ncbi:NAD-binding 6-phosphogluconate dehydrogenase [Frankia sp. EAN1pec] [Mycobacterium shimoidei]|uniref:NAD-binding 6-phosphogluconate dehydrogenase [Frankia sp. EAN1pec] n=1 Tax=Mycobacterium shimoidei TaxID=29313 RepID=A0A375YXT7_MYCSH|nr:NAD(P)-dependent oxidoreductase [Mycobacterium shimoidei]SRX93698.1 NAD-binding 6-phosphogluconate dehydrogenase [Frankia sp. EAN1pec] [Mycobacterium shimoidei]